MLNHSPNFPDRLLAFAARGVAAGILIILLLIIGELLHLGAGRLSWEFLSSAPRNAGRDGGIAPILVSTAMILVIAMAVAMPIGIGTAVVLAEQTRKNSPFGRAVRFSLDVLAGVPSIVFGLFGSIFFCKILGFGFSILAGGLTLGCMVLPILTRTAEEGFRSVPADFSLGAAALAYSKTATFFHLLLPAAMPSVMAGTMLGIGRALAETAALLFTSGYVDRMPETWLDSGRAMSVHIYDLSMNVGGGDGTAGATSLMLVLVLIVINSLVAKMASLLGNRKMLK